MADVQFLQKFDSLHYAIELDWLMSPVTIIGEAADLQSAVIVALGTDALASKTEQLPDLDATDRRGWWGDMDAEEIWGAWPVGSKLWLLSRAKITGPLASEGGTVARANSYARDAMRPFITNRIASKVDVDASRTATGRIDVSVVLNRGPDLNIELRYADLWDELGTL